MRAVRQSELETVKETATEEQMANLATFCKALGHPLRLEILQALRTEERCACGDLVARLPVAQSTVSQHLKVLKQSGLVSSEAAGPSTYYCVDQHRVAAFKAMVAGL